MLDGIGRLVTADLAIMIERAEARAMADSYRAAVRSDDLGPQVADIGSATALGLRGPDLAPFNRTIGLGVGQPATEFDLDGIVAFYRGLERKVAFVQVAPDARPPEIATWLRSRGLAQWGRWAKCYRSLDDLPDASATIRIERIDRSDARTFADICTAAFRFPPEVAPIATATIGRPGWTHYIGYHDDAPASIAALYVSERVAWLGYGATLEGFRGRGGQSALIAARLRDAASLGCGLACSETGEETSEGPNPALRNMVRAGFQIAYMRENWIWRR